MDATALYKLIGVGLYLAILVGIGVAASRRMKDMRDYYTGGKKLGFLSIAFSARATGESAWLLLGLSGMGAAYGVKAFWVVLGEMIGVGCAWILMARRFKRLDAETSRLYRSAFKTANGTEYQVVTIDGTNTSIFDEILESFSTEVPAP